MYVCVGCSGKLFLPALVLNDRQQLPRPAAAQIFHWSHIIHCLAVFIRHIVSGGHTATRCPQLTVLSVNCLAGALTLCNVLNFNVVGGVPSWSALYIPPPNKRSKKPSSSLKKVSGMCTSVSELSWRVGDKMQRDFPAMTDMNAFFRITRIPGGCLVSKSAHCEINRSKCGSAFNYFTWINALPAAASDRNSHFTPLQLITLQIKY